jgi:hypothetical protein
VVLRSSSRLPFSITDRVTPGTAGSSEDSVVRKFVAPTPPT